MKRKIFIVAAIIFSSRLFAQPVTTNQGDTSSKTLDEVILAANKYPQKQSETGKVITVITRQQLERSSGKTLGEVLNNVAGVIIPGANNDLGTNLTANIRGASAGNVLILVDGLPLNDPSVNTNYFDLNFFAIDQVERIEILKGGQSTLYGSDAVAGVINIITKKNESKKWGLTAGLSGGSYNTFKENIGLGGNGKKINYSVRYTHLSSDGFSAAYDSVGNKNFDKDGFNEHALSGDLGWKISKNLKAKVFGSYGYYKTDLDASAFTDEKDYTVKNKNLQNGAGLVCDHRMGSFHFNYLFNYVSRDYLDDSVYRSSPYVIYSKGSYIGRTHFAEIYDNWKWTSFELLAGADYRYNNTHQEYFSTGLFGPYSPPVLNKNMNQVSSYASLIYKKNGLTAEAGGRWNHHSDYGNNFTYTINPSYLIAKKAKIFANLYSAFKSPTLYQLFDPSFGNTGLKPEKGIIAEAGTEFFSNSKFDLRVVGFYRRTKNEIDFIITNPSTFESHYRNISSQENYGAEMEAVYNFQKWNFSANYTYTNGKTKSGYDGTGFPLTKDTVYYNLYRIPKNVFNFSAALQATKKIYLSSSLKLVSKRQEFIYGSGPVILKNYCTINLYGEYHIGSNWKLFLDLKNITGQKYFDILGYNSKRFNFMAGVNFILATDYTNGHR